MNQITKLRVPYMSAEEFLLWPGDGSDNRFQLVDGEVRLMAPASRIHGVLQANLAYLLVSAVRAAGLPYQVAAEGAIIPVRGAVNNVRLPDLVVGPGNDQKGDQVVADPIVIVEILSPGNTDDTRDNVLAYLTLPSVREVVVVHSNRIMAEIYRRDAVGAWLVEPEIVDVATKLVVASIGLEMRLEEAYANTWLTRDERSALQ
jgi:Uma2 family endonuclease